MSCLSRRLVALSTAAALQAVVLLPSVHAHLVSHHDDDHASGAIHRHWAPHQPASPAFTLGVDDDHGLVWSMGSIARLPEAARVHPDTHVVVVVDPSITPVVRVWALSPRPLFSSTHDPPWADSSGLRAPPLSRL